MNTLNDKIYEAATQSGDVTFRNDYSGRGMYGKSCVGIMGSMVSCMSVITEIIKELHAQGVAEDGGVEDFFDDNIEHLNRGVAFPQYYGNAIPYGDRVTPWCPMDFHYYFWMHLKCESCELKVPNWTDDTIETLMMGGEL